jgi:hypothetical protein
MLWRVTKITQGGLMTPEEEIRQEIVKQFGDKYNLKDVEFKVVIQEKATKPHDIAESGSVIDFVGMVGKYFIYVVKTGYKTLKFICSLIAIYNLITVYVPNGYDFISHYGKQLFAGDISVVQEKGKVEDGCLVMKKGWIEDQNSFQQDYTNFQKGHFGTLDVPDAEYFPVSGSVKSIVNGTTATNKFSFGTKT